MNYGESSGVLLVFPPPEFNILWDKHPDDLIKHL